MRSLWNSEWRSLLLGVILTCLLALLAAGAPGVKAANWQPQTVPSPTPQTIPAPVTPQPNETPFPPGPPAPPQLQGQGQELQLLQTVSRTDVLPGEEVTLTLQATNASPQAMLSLILVAPLDPMLQPLAVSGVRGAVERQGYSLHIHLGTLEPGQSVQVAVRIKIGGDTPPGTIFVHRFSAFYLDGEASSNAVGFGLPPEELPPTGKNGRTP